jgi:hypothetical protein
MIVATSASRQRLAGLATPPTPKPSSLFSNERTKSIWSRGTTQLPLPPRLSLYQPPCRRKKSRVDSNRFSPNTASRGEAVPTSTTPPIRATPSPASTWVEEERQEPAAEAQNPDGSVVPEKTDTGADGVVRRLWRCIRVGTAHAYEGWSSEEQLDDCTSPECASIVSSCIAWTS